MVAGAHLTAEMFGTAAHRPAGQPRAVTAVTVVTVARSASGGVA